MSKQVTLTDDEVEMIREDVESTREWGDINLEQRIRYGIGTKEENEKMIAEVRTAESILKKLGSS